MKNDINPDILECLKAMEQRNITHIFLVACGGSLAIMQPGKYFLDRHSPCLSSDIYNSAEFVARNPQRLNSTSLVILCSQTGTTKESVRAAQHAREKGALTIAMTMEPHSPLAQAAEYTILYQASYTTGVAIDAADSNYAVLYMLLAGLLRLSDEREDLIPTLLSSLNNLQKTIDKAQNHYDAMFDLYAARYTQADVIYTVGSGVNYGAAYSFAICVLMEMLWINSQAIHANEFFHGPFEVVDEKAKFILMLGLDETRSMEWRAGDFLNRFGSKDNILTLDAHDLDLGGIDEIFKPYFIPLIFFDVLWQFAYKLAAKRGKIMLEGRRYMKKLSDY